MEEEEEAGDYQTTFHFENFLRLSKQNDDGNNPPNAGNDFNSSEDEALGLKNSLDGVEIPLDISLPQHQVKDQPRGRDEDSQNSSNAVVDPVGSGKGQEYDLSREEKAEEDDLNGESTVADT